MRLCMTVIPADLAFFISSAGTESVPGALPFLSSLVAVSKGPERCRKREVSLYFNYFSTFALVIA